MTPWANFFWLIITFLMLLVLGRWITAHVQGLGFVLSKNRATAVWLYFFFFLPGIFIHEASHYVTAQLLGVSAGGFTLWPKIKRGRQLVLGSVTVRGAGPVRHSLIGAAPLFVGGAAVLLIGRFLHFNVLGEAIAGGDLYQIFNAADESLSTPDFWLWLYLLFAVANSMLPSQADRIYWPPVLLFLGVIAVLAVGLDLIPAIPEPFQEYLSGFIAFMASAFSFAVAVDLFFVLFIFILETIMGLATGRRLQY